MLVDGCVEMIASSTDCLVQHWQCNQCDGLRKAVLWDSRGWAEKTYYVNLSAGKGEYIGMCFCGVEVERFVQGDICLWCKISASQRDRLQGKIREDILEDIIERTDEF